MGRPLDVVKLTGDEYDRLMDEREVMRKDCERAWKEVDAIAKERDQHARWRQDLADQLGECEKHRDAIGKALALLREAQDVIAKMADGPQHANWGEMLDRIDAMVKS